MQALQRIVLAVTVATVALLAPVAHAQGGEQYKFVDKDGPGTLSCERVVRIPCSDLVSCKCFLYQNGWVVYGTGCISDSGSISCTFTHKAKVCGCNTYSWQPIDCMILVCRLGGGGGWHVAGYPQNSYCCQLTY